MTQANSSITVTDQASGVEYATHAAASKEHPVVMVADEDGHILNSGKPLTISFAESVAAPTATTWYLKRQWAPAAGVRFRPVRTKSAITTAGSRTLIGVARLLGTWNCNGGTGIFTDGGSVASPEHYSRLFAVVTTAMSAVSNTVTVTYTKEDGTTGRATVALSIPASAPVGNAFEFVLQATTGQMRDVGVRDVTAVTDTAAPTGVIEIWGVNPLHEAQGVANAFEVGMCDEFAVVNPEFLFIALMQAATTAQQRCAILTGSVEA